MKSRLLLIGIMLISLPCLASSVKSRKNRSTRFIRDEEVGVKCGTMVDSLRMAIGALRVIDPDPEST